MTGPITQSIQEKLTDALNPTKCIVIDDSARHAGHMGSRPEGETHFTVHIVSEAFHGQNRVARHRAIYAALKEELDAGLHALAIEAYTPEEAEA